MVLFSSNQIADILYVLSNNFNINSNKSNTNGIGNINFDVDNNTSLK